MLMVRYCSTSELAPSWKKKKKSTIRLSGGTYFISYFYY